LPVGLTASAALFLAAGLTTPVVTLRRGLSHDSYSVLGGIADLAHSDQLLLALIVLAFSFVFPIAKLVLLGALLASPVGEERRARLLRILGALGRWSMLDVFVVAILIGAVKLGMISEAHAERGIYVFASAILLSMFATVSVDRSARAGVPARRLAPVRSSAIERGLSLAALVLFAVGLGLPLMVVQKFRFWDNEYSVLGATRRMFAEGEHLLAGAVLFFVVALPLAHLTGLALLRWTRTTETTLRVLLELEKWAMLDVFGLALLVVVAKIGAVASVEIESGFWVLLAAAGLSLIDARALRQSLTTAS